VLRDAPLTELSDDDLRAVLRPKPGAGHLLDRLTRHRALDFFVVHSSIAACVGNFRQVPYVAANAAMEALVRDRRRAGLPGLAVQWGSVTDTGAAHHSGQIEQLGQVFGKLPVAEALREQDDLLCHPEVDVVAVGRFRWDRLSRVLPTLTAPRTAALLPTREDTTAADRVRGALAGADPARALPLIEQVLVELLARVLQTPADRIAPDRRLDQLGVDSLMAAEFTTLVHRHLDCYLPAVELAGTPTLTALAHRVHARLGHAAPGGSAEEDRRGAAEPR
jgi:acyl carrier protein